ncbi:cysteine hydrolase [Sphaerotilus montanus]|uniref:Nicotinamidase-related amidase n=1 Tax=Sphaerotilus montanus TaxID=522889 RepID=A0A7Y9U8I2_9BURK|nr:cysteine hydrolase [Sphaerotilus montanus]NYG34631.1 nicotinamidase-related amidase [Sphaerotilus montanus]NZD58985.1 cysteine hydrolase [Sphaerotilus montanus]
MPVHLNSVPYPWPYDGQFTPANTALVIIDMQTDFCGVGGYVDKMGYDLSQTRAPIEPLKQLLAEARRTGLHVIHTREGHRPDLSDCPPAKRLRGAPGLRIGDAGPMGRLLLQGEPGHAIIPELAPVDGELVLDKPGKGAFYGTDLQARLAERGITHLVFTGVTNEVCVQTTMREANDRGYDCVLIEDATESYFPEFKAATLAMVRAQGAIVGWTATSTDLIAALPG